MAEYYIVQIDGRSELQYNFQSREGSLRRHITKDEMSPTSTIEDLDPVSSPSIGSRRVHRETTSKGQPPKRARAKESSKHFGVRFRPDLSKWVAEIRVAEWKTVDKKVWLGTYETEEGAARGVDAARKLLNCKKKRGYNFPCLQLDVYSEQIPSNLNLSNLANDSMFKEVTLYVKRKAQEYASSFSPNHSNCKPLSSDQAQVIVATSFYSQEQEELSYENSLNCLPVCKSVVECPISSPSVSGGQIIFSTSPSSAGSSPEDDGWQLCDSTIGSTITSECTFGAFQKCNYSGMMSSQGLMQVEEQSIDGGNSSDFETMNASPSSWEDQILFPDDLDDLEYMMQDGEDVALATGFQFPIPSDYQDYAHDEAESPNIIPGDLMSYDESSLMSDYSLQITSFGLIDTSLDWMPHRHKLGLDDNLLTKSQLCS